MIKLTFLQSLVGLPLGEAENKAKEEGFEFWSLPEGAITTLLADLKIRLYHKDRVVTSTSFGDPTKVVGGDLGPVYIGNVFSTKGRGPTVTLNTKECPNAKKLKVGDSLIQGAKEAEIVGIEKFSKLLSPPIPGDNIELLLSEKLEPGEVYPNYQ